MSDYQTIDELEEMVRRFGGDMITQQANAAQRLFNIPLPSEDEELDAPEVRSRQSRPFPVVDMRGIDIVNVMNGVPGNLGMVATGGERNAESSVDLFSGKQKPKTLAGSLFFSTDEIEMNQGPQAVNKVKKVFKAAGSGAGKYLARAFVNPQVAEPAADVLATATSMVVTSGAGYWSGQTYVVTDDATGAEVGRFRVRDLIPDFDTEDVTIKFKTANGQIGFPIDVSAQSIYLLGMDDEDLRIGSIADATDDTVDLYGLDQEDFPAGIRHALGAAFGHEDGRRLCSKMAIASGEPGTHWIGSLLAIDGIVNDQIDNVRFVMGQSDSADMDPYSAALTPYFNGLPCIGEFTYDDDVLDLVNAEDAELRVYWPYLPRGPDAKQIRPGQEGGANALVLSDRVGAEAHFDGGYATVFHKRRSFARFTSVTV